MSTLPVARQWGDIVTTRERHIIEGISYRDDLSWITCSCGSHFEAATPEALAAPWTAHGGKLLTSGFDLDEPPAPAPDPTGGYRLMLQLVEAQMNCSCAVTTVYACPNYMPGDELLDEVTND